MTAPLGKTAEQAVMPSGKVPAPVQEPKITGPTSAAEHFREQAGESLGRAGELLAGAEAGVHAAVSALNRAVDLAHATGITPDLARSLVTRIARLGDIGRADHPRIVLPDGHPSEVSGSASANGTIPMPATRKGD